MPISLLPLLRRKSFLPPLPRAPMSPLARGGKIGTLRLFASLFLARRLNLEVAEVPVVWGHDDRSKIHPLRDGFSIVWDMLRVRYYALSGQYGHVKRAAVASAVGSRL